MVRITPDFHSVSSMAGLQIRSKFQIDSKLYQIWLPKGVRDDVEGKCSSDMETWLVELIDKNKKFGSDEHGKKVYNDTVQRRKDISKFNI